MVPSVADGRICMNHTELIHFYGGTVSGARLCANIHNNVKADQRGATGIKDGYVICAVISRMRTLQPNQPNQPSSDLRLPKVSSFETRNSGEPLEILINTNITKITTLASYIQPSSDVQQKVITMLATPIHLFIVTTDNAEKPHGVTEFSMANRRCVCD